MTRRPNEFLILSIFAFLIPVGLPLQTAFIYGPDLLHPMVFLSRLAPLNWVVVVLASLNGFLLLRASQALKFSVPLFLVAVLWNNWLVAEMGLNSPGWAAFLASFGSVFAHLLLLRLEPRTLLASPDLRWWLTPKRKPLSVIVEVRPVLGGELQSTALNISAGGALISVGTADREMMRAVPIKNLDVGVHCAVRLALDQLNVIQCQAQIVRQSPVGRGEYPQSFAVKFLGLDRNTRRALEAYCEA
jgi:hypothetical protein